MIKKRAKLNKKVVYILSIIVILLIVYFLFEYQRGKIERYNAQYKTSDELLSTKKYRGLTIKNIKFNEIDGRYEFTAEVKNETDKIHQIEPVNVVFLDQKGNKVCEVSSSLPMLNIDSTLSMYAMVDEKCKKAYTFVIEKEGE